MSQIAVEKVRDGGAAPPHLFERTLELAEKIRDRAFELFERRGRADGRSLEDWLNAEREIIQSPQAELIEKDGKFHVRIAVPGFDMKDIHVTALPTTLLVRAEAKHSEKKKEGDVYFSEFGQKYVFRRVDLPAPVNVDKVTATFDHGMLELAAPKSVDPAKVKAIGA